MEKIFFYFYVLEHKDILIIYMLQYQMRHWLWYYFPGAAAAAAAAAASLQSCPTLCDPTDGNPPGSPVPGILQARTLEWVAISFSNAWKRKVKVKLLSHVQLFSTPWTAAHQAPPSMGFSRQEYWSGVPLPSLWQQLLQILDLIKTHLRKPSFFFLFLKLWKYDNTFTGDLENTEQSYTIHYNSFK